MAEPISLDRPLRNPRKELQARLDAAPLEHAEALLDSMELLEELHQRGVFDLLRGVLGAGDQIVDRTVEAADSAAGIRALRNLIILGKWLSSINPELLQCVANASAATLGSEEKPVIEPPGLLSLLSQFRQPELRRSIALINRFLDVLGNQLKTVGSVRPPQK
ncbi:MAG TPA: hypothetical protein VL986_04195 [Terracidiphilus sp.]|nr:hypothetical protein [Terracidiphilus sp.]